MKQIKNFILMSVLLLMGSVCWAQETTKKDSIWGLELGDVDTNGYISLSFYTNIERERVKGIGGDFFYNNELSSYFYTNTYSSKAGVICDYLQENDSIYKITLHNVIFYSLNDSFLIQIDLENNEKSNVLRWNKADKTGMDFQRVERGSFEIDNYEVIYVDMTGRHLNTPPHGCFLKCYYKGNCLKFVSKQYNG